MTSGAQGRGWAAHAWSLKRQVPRGPCAPGLGQTALKVADEGTGANNPEAAATRTSPRTQAHAGMRTHRHNLQPPGGCSEGPQVRLIVTFGPKSPTGRAVSQTLVLGATRARVSPLAPQAC